MSASSCIVFYGLKYTLEHDEITRLEDRSDVRISAARRVGLQYYWGNFGGSSELYILFVGHSIAILGDENPLGISLPEDNLESIFSSTNIKLRTGEFSGPPSLHIQWQPDA